MKQYTKLKVVNTLQPGLCEDNLLTANRRPQRSLSSRSLGQYWQLNQNNQETEQKLMQYKMWPNKQEHTEKLC